jgi:dienelactone hydrolase
MTAMKYKHFNMTDHGFVGHLAQPDAGSDRAVIVIMGGEKGLLPGIKIAERFADFGFAGLSVSLFGADGLPDSPNSIPLEMFGAAIDMLRSMGFKSVSIYAMSMGTIFAALAAEHFGGVDSLVLCSPTHVPFEGTLADRKTMTGRSVVTLGGEDIPYVTADFSSGGMMKYVHDSEAGRKVTKMWCAYRDAYGDKERVDAAALHIEKTGARVLMIAGGHDEAWWSEYSVRYMKKRLDKSGCNKDFKALIFPKASHLIGMMPNRKRERLLYAAVPLIGLAYRSFLTDRAVCMRAFELSEREIVRWLAPDFFGRR